MKKRLNKVILIAGILLIVLISSAVQMFWGLTYAFKYFYYDHNGWGEITYISDRIRSNQPYPDHINIQVALDEPINGNSYYSITFDSVSKMRKRQRHIEFKGSRALIVYNDFSNSDGDVITKTDIIISIISAVIFIVDLLSIIFIVKYIYNHNDISKEVEL